MKILYTMGLALLLPLAGLIPVALVQGGGQQDKKDKKLPDGLKALTHPDVTVRINPRTC